jgi:hypothetical protein
MYICEVSDGDLRELIALIYNVYIKSGFPIRRVRAIIVSNLVSEVALPVPVLLQMHHLAVKGSLNLRLGALTRLL